MPSRSNTKLTLRTVNAAEPTAEPYILSDSDLPGFGLRVLPAGGKHYILRYRTNGQRRLYAIGRHGSPWTPESARKEATRLLGLVASGQDPQADKERQKREGATARANTFHAVADEFVQQYSQPRKRTWREDRRILDVYVLPLWGERPIGSITRADVDRLVEDIAQRGAGVMANRTLALVKTLFGWALSKPRFGLDASPVVRISMPRHEQPRERSLTDTEVKAIWGACLALGYPFGPAIQLLLLTGARRDMVASMRRQDIDLGKRVWAVPSEFMKSKRPHLVPLSPLAMDIINAIPAFEGTDYLFPAQRAGAGDRHISGFSKAKAKLDALSGVSGWRFHDFRRTLTTGLGELGIPKHIRKLLLDHAEQDVHGLHYDQYSYLREKAAALELWSNKVQGLVTPSPDNVVPLRA